jgi:tripartite-type tricarboxylate transporter receptor subunit TctC
MIRPLSHRVALVLALTGVFAGACGPAAPATSSPSSPTVAVPSASPTAFNEQVVADFYRGKTITIIVSQAPGGGYDTYARLVARKLGEYIPGKPTVIVENMTGGGGLVAANHVATAAPKDGTRIVLFPQGLIFAARAKAAGVEFDPLTLNWIGNPIPDYVPCVFRSALGFNTFQDAVASGKVLNFGSTGAGADTWYLPKILEASGLGKWNVILGYNGIAAVRLAVEQGELDGVCSTGLVQTARAWYQGDKPFAKILLQSGKTRSADLPNVPTWREVNLSPEVIPLVDAAEATEVISRPFAMAAGVPADRVAAVRAAWLKAWKDPDVLDAATKAGFAVNAQGHQVLEAAVRTVMALPESQIPRLKVIFGLQ